MLKIAWSPEFSHPLPEGHRFPMLKYELIPEQLLYEGTITSDNLFKPVPLSEEAITSTHKHEYYQKLKTGRLSASEMRRTGFPYSEELIFREEIIVSGTVQSSLYALENGVGMNIAGGTHHAFSDKGEGFCLLNDIAVAANYLLNNNLRNRILIVDLDVHQGNGTAEIFQENNRVITFSMHGKNNYPYHKEKSDLDVELLDGVTDKEYQALLQKHLSDLIQIHEPDFVFYQSGVDVLLTDKLGKLSLTRKGTKERDRIVLETCKSNKIPLAISMGGGYSEKIFDIVEAHCNTFRLAQELFF